MPLFILVIGILLVDTGFHGTASDFFKQLKADVSGFLAFGAAILILGGIGAIKELRGISQAMLVLVFVAFFLRNGQAIAENVKGSVAGGINVPPIDFGKGAVW